MRGAVVPWRSCFNFGGGGETNLLGAESDALQVVSVFGGSDYARTGHGNNTVCGNVRSRIDPKFVIERHDVINPQMDEGDVISFVSHYEGENGEKRYKLYCESKTQAGIRFGVCKELMHILTETVDTIEGGDNCNALLYSNRYWRYCLNPSYPDVDIDDEEACFYLAVETLIPWCLRAQLETVCANHNQASVENIKVIAQAFQVPHQVISHVLGQYPGIKKLGNGQLLIDSYFKFVSNPMNKDYDDNGRVCPLFCFKSQSEAQAALKE